MDSNLKPKPILNRAELKQIKRTRTRIEGRKVITDDVRKLKSLKVTPDIKEEDKFNYYKEPIWIEYYIPKESRFALETKYLFIYLIDPVPREGKDKYLEQAIKENRPVDIFKIIESRDPNAEEIKKSYTNTMSFLETISDSLDQFQTTQDPEFFKTCVYLTETLMGFEPTLANLEYLGDFSIWNLHWFIRRLNEHNTVFSLEDRTISLLLKRRNAHWEEHELEEDEDFELLSALFFEQAYPHRGAEALEAQDFLLD